MAVEQFGVFAGRSLCDGRIVEFHHGNNILGGRGDQKLVGAGGLLDSQRFFDDLQADVPARLEREFAVDGGQNVSRQRGRLQGLSTDCEKRRAGALGDQPGLVDEYRLAAAFSRGIIGGKNVG